MKARLFQVKRISAGVYVGGGPFRPELSFFHSTRQLKMKRLLTDFVNSLARPEGRVLI